jgi:Family of unknown function (DUF5767)
VRKKKVKMSNISIGPVIEEVSLDDLPSKNFGPGAELLMNKKRDAVEVSDLDKLEKELLDFVPVETPKSEGVRFAEASVPRTEGVKFVEPDPVEPKLVDFSKKEEVKETNASWDGFKSVNSVDPDAAPPAPDMTKEELLRAKFSVLRKLEDLEKKGVTLTKKYSMESSLQEMQGEYETLVVEKERKNSIKFQGKMLMAVITGIEFLNSKFDPFDVKLDGWAEQINENIDDYDEIFSELHEKYKSKAKMAPELKLLFQLGGGAIMLHMTNTMFKSAIPGMDDIMRQNPDLMQKFTQAAVSSAANTSPGFSSFMNTVSKDHKSEKRGEMKGPTDISDILSGLKKTVTMDDEGSTVSVSELREMSADLKMPRKSKKRSDKNSISLEV